MSLTSPGQSNNELAHQIYKLAGSYADKLVKLGKIAASERDSFFGQTVKGRLEACNLPVPKHILAKAGNEVAKASTTVSAQTANAVATTTARVGAAQTAGQVFRSGAPIAAAIFLAQGVWNIGQCLDGQITTSELGKRTAESAATSAGGLAGAAAGAAIGSLIPVVGTLIGGLIGGFGGSAGLRKLTRMFTRNSEQ